MLLKNEFLSREFKRKKSIKNFKMFAGIRQINKVYIPDTHKHQKVCLICLQHDRLSPSCKRHHLLSHAFRKMKKENTAHHILYRYRPTE